MDSAYEVVRNEAESLSVNDLRPFMLHLAVVKANAIRGVEAVDRREAELVAYSKKYEAAGPKLLTLIEALEETTMHVDLARPFAQGTRKLLDPVYEDRETLVGQLVTWSRIGLVPINEVERIKAGKGAIDAAQDVLDVVNITRRYPATKAKLVNTPAEVEAMVTRAKELLGVLTPNGVRKTNEALDQAVDAQSRVWALLLKQHERLWKHGAFLFGRDVDEYVPALGSRSVTRRKSDPVEDPTPAEPINP